jgi:glycosyltransferase involved in cell wall biosynthesis
MNSESHTTDPMMADSGKPAITLAHRVYSEEYDDSMEGMLQETRISVVVPVYNEAQTIAKVIGRVLECGFDAEIIVVDDASTDGTREFLQTFHHPNVKIVYHQKNRGKGAALRSGFALASRPYVFVQDADLEYDPKDFALMLPPLVDGRADMVYGSRFLSGPHRVLFFWHYVGNRLLTLVSNIITDLNLSDMETGQKAFLREKLMSLKLSADRFTFEPEITAKAARARWRVYEVPISYSGRTYEEGKKIGWRDAVAAIWAIFYYRFIGQLTEGRM